MSFKLNLKKGGAKGRRKANGGKVDFSDGTKDGPAKVTIDSYDDQGAKSNDVAVDAVTPLVIKPQQHVTSLIQAKRTRRVVEAEETAEDKNMAQLLLDTDPNKEQNQPRIEATGLTIAATEDNATSDNSDDDYNQVPVEDFGAAMLRGMGYTGDEEDKQTETPASKLAQILKKRQRGQVLGIGAKPLDADLHRNVFGDRGDKLEVALVKRPKKDTTSS